MKLNKRTVALLVSFAVLLSAAVGVTVAYIVDRTPDVENTFKPSRVACEVIKEDGNDVYTVKNTGDTDAYIRVAVVVNWKNGSNVYAQAPQFDVDLGANWGLGKDGHYYYIKPVAGGAQIPETLTVRSNSVAPSNEYELVVEVYASAIQATSAAVDQWSNGVATASSDGAALSVKTQ